MDYGAKKCTGFRVVSYIVLTILAICCIVPLLNVIMISITDESAIKDYGYMLIPKKFDFSAYRLLASKPESILQAYKITAIVTFAGTLISVLIGTSYAYTLSRRNFLIRRQTSFYLYFTMLFSGGLIPTYILVAHILGLKNNLLALILPYCVAPYNIFLTRTFIQQIPAELFEAAKMDGASEHKILYSLVYPMCKGGIATIVMFNLLGFWNAWQPCLYYISDSRYYTLQYMLQVLMNRISTLKMEMDMGMQAATALASLPENSLRMATCLIAIGPLIVAFPFFQKYFVHGIAVGSVKG